MEKTKLIIKSTFQLHPPLQTLFKATRGTLFPRGNRDWTCGTADTHVVLSVLHRPLEEALAGLAGEDAVVKAGNLVPANRTGTVDQLLPGDASGGGQLVRVRHGQLIGQ